MSAVLYVGACPYRRAPNQVDPWTTNEVLIPGAQIDTKLRKA